MSFSPAHPEATTQRGGLVSVVALGALRAYKIIISPLFSGSCRFYPSCADYMADAIRMYGAARGIGLGLRRLARCHPFGGHGVDPVVPPAHSTPLGAGPSTSLGAGPSTLLGTGPSTSLGAGAPRR